MKFNKLVTFMAIVGLSTSSFATKTKMLDDDYSARDYDNPKDYDSNYYEDQGALMVKIRASGIISHAKQKKLPAPTSKRGKANPAGSGSLISNGYGLEAATVLFFSENFAAELSAGFQVYKTSRTAVDQAANNYSDVAVAGKRKNLYAIPVNLTLQWHMAPFGAIRPYAGGGYNGTYFINKSKEYRVNNTSGPVLQAGVDFVMNDDTVINVDMKKIFVSPKLSYKSTFVGSSVSGRIPINPWIISAGMGWTF